MTDNTPLKDLAEIEKQRQAGIDKLTKLGLTEDEARAIAGA